MMKKGANPLTRPLNFHKQNPIYVKLVLFLLLLGVTIFLFSSNSVDSSAPSSRNQTSLDGFDSQEDTDDSQDTDLVITTETDDVDSQEAEIELNTSDEGAATSTSTKSQSKDAKQKCDLFKGRWVPNPSGPSYTNHTCKTIEPTQNCMKNGRPDTGYLYLRWQPEDCDLPKFNPQTFLEFMRNKYFAFIGDSISRNHVQSMLCILSQVEEPETIYHDEEWKSTTWIFPSYNFTIDRIWAPFLLKAVTFEDNNGVASDDTRLHVDKLDEKWTKHYQKFDYAIISGGKWFMKRALHYENNRAIGCHDCFGKNNLTETGFEVAYRKAINLVFNFITSSSHKPKILFRTITPSHFENGDWNTGGTCRRKVPFKPTEVNVTDIDTMLYNIQVQEYDSALSKASENGVEMMLFDTTKLSLLRPDGHPGEYRQFQPFAKDKNAKVQSDCLHWCLPGPIDSWNDLLMETLMNS